MGTSQASGLNRKYHTNGPEAHQFPLAYGPEAIAEKTLLFFGSGYARLAQCYTGFPALRPTMSTPTKATKPKAKNTPRKSAEPRIEPVSISINPNE